jgi:hypothetical protein
MIAPRVGSGSIESGKGMVETAYFLDFGAVLNGRPGAGASRGTAHSGLK